LTVDRNGFRWVAGSSGSDESIGYDPHEANLEPAFRRLLGEDGVFADVGAHVGHWAVRLAAQARKVIAVEPDPATAAVLRENVALNGLANVTVVEAAAWDCDEPLRLEDPLGRERSGTTRTLPGSGDAASLTCPDCCRTVRGRRLDDILAGEPEIRLIKIDTEGADLHVLRGLKETLARCQPSMIVERHDFLGYYRAADLFSLLGDLGYRWQDGPLYAGVPHLICTPAPVLRFIGTGRAG
jgi:FkbM family methyltransferase